MTSCYLLTPASDPDVIGVKNFDVQAEIRSTDFQDKTNYDYLLKVLGSNYFWENNVSVKKLELVVERVQLKERAKLTDFVRFSPALINIMYLVSEVVKNEILAMNCAHVCFFDTALKTEVDVHSYSLMYVESLDRRLLDYEKSTFCTGDEIMGIDVQRFHSEFDENRFSLECSDLAPLEIVLREDCSEKPDIFSIYGSTYVSFKLAKVILEKGFSGVVVNKATPEGRIIFKKL